MTITLALVGDVPVAGPLDLHTDGCIVQVEQYDWQPVSDIDSSDLAARLIGSGASVVCFGDDLPLPLVIDTCAALDAEHSEVVTVLVRRPDTELWQSATQCGVREIVDPATVETDLPAALQRSLDRAARLRTAVHDSGPERGRTVAVISPKGGSGKTMLSTNLAAALAPVSTGGVVLVDLDTMFGDVALTLGLVPERTIDQLATVSPLDVTTLKVFLTRHEPTGMYVLCGAEQLEEGEVVSPDLVRSLLELLRNDFEFVVVDTAAGIDDRTLAALEVSTDVILLAAPEVASVRDLGKEVDVLRRLSLLPARRHLVLNRADADVGLELRDVETVLGMSSTANIPSSRLVQRSMNQGRPVVLEAPQSNVTEQIEQLARRLTGRDEVQRPRRSPFSLRRH